MTREEYEKLYDSEPDAIELTDEDILEWLNNIVDAFKQLRKCRYDLYYGKLDRCKGEYENYIELCSMGALELHVYDGIDRLAKITGDKLQVFDSGDEGDKYRYTYFFKYKGVKIFQLERELARKGPK